ncbi:MAG: hypothetical protein NVS4B12_03770 [Ktedonobacteraceae bacterium]
MAHDPRQTVIDFLSTPVSAIDSPLLIDSDTKLRKGVLRTSGGVGAIPSAIRILKERSIPLHYASLITFEDGAGRTWEFACFVVQEGQHNWVFKGGGSVSQKNVDSQPHVNLAGGWAEGGFSAGGRVNDNGIAIAHVDIVSVDGLLFDDTVDDGRVLFVTDREDIFPPVRALLYDSTGALVNSHIVFGL